MRASRVDGGIRSLAAPDGPETLASTEKTSVVLRMMGLFNYVLQLTDIARPVVGLQQIQCLLVD